MVAHLEKKNHRLARVRFREKKGQVGALERYARSVKIIDNYLIII